MCQAKLHNCIMVLIQSSVLNKLVCYSQVSAAAAVHVSVSNHGCFELAPVLQAALLPPSLGPEILSLLTLGWCGRTRHLSRASSDWSDSPRSNLGSSSQNRKRSMDMFDEPYEPKRSRYTSRDDLHGSGEYQPDADRPETLGSAGASGFLGTSSGGIRQSTRPKRPPSLPLKVLRLELSPHCCARELHTRNRVCCSVYTCCQHLTH